MTWAVHYIRKPTDQDRKRMAIGIVRIPSIELTDDLDAAERYATKIRKNNGVAVVMQFGEKLEIDLASMVPENWTRLPKS